MTRRLMLCRAALCVLVLLMGGGACAWAQKVSVPSRVVDTVDDTRTVRLEGNVHPLARAEYDQGALADSQPLTRMLLLLQRSAEQEQALRLLLDAQQTKSSGSYHAWVTPEEFGRKYGPSDADIQAVTDWLTRQGFTVKNVAAGRNVIEFDGNVAQVRNAFHTELHRFVVNAEERFANVSDPAIPEALVPVVQGVVALHNFPKHALVRRVGTFQRDLATGKVTSLFTYTDLDGTFFGVGPKDFAAIYNIPGTADGAGQSIAIVGDSNINTQDVVNFRSMFGLPAYTTISTAGVTPGCQLCVVVNGPDPGLNGDEIEADLDVEWAGAVAPAAQIIFVTSEDSMTTGTSGIDLSALYIIDNNLAPVMSESFGTCEAFLGTTGNAFYNVLWEQATAEGITVSIPSGDTGPASCDPHPNDLDPFAANQGLAVNGIASTPFDVAVGGTDFDQANNQGAYWNTSNTTTTPPIPASALGYIPEIPWDDSQCAANYLLNPAATPCTSVDTTAHANDLTAAGGGPSNCALPQGSGCTGYPKPSYQQSLTPADSTRDIPDVSLFSSNGGLNGQNKSFYIICESDANLGGVACDLSSSTTSRTENFIGIGGTSAAAPTFAAILALVNQSEVSQGRSGRQGNANYVLYALAAKEGYPNGASLANCNSSSFTTPANPAPASCVFYDITKGTNTVACDATSSDCSNTASSYGVILDTASAYNGSGTPGFKAVRGYDLATGIGSINVAHLLASWNTAGRTATTTTLGTPSPASGKSGQTFSVPVTVTSTSGTATGPVSLTALASDKTTILGSITCCTSTGIPFTHSGGSATITTNLLPPNTTYVEGFYGGDATHAVSTSAPVALGVSGAGQASKTTVGFVTFDITGAPILPPSLGPVTAAYGSPYILQIAVTNSNGTSCTSASGSTATNPGTPCPTGTITLKDNGALSPDFPNGVTTLNNQGIAEDQPIQLVAGPHSLQASYAGDPNYQASPSNTLSVTIGKAATATGVATSATMVPKGGTVTIMAVVDTQSNGEAPCGGTTNGTVQFTSNGTPLTGTVSYTPLSGAQSPTGTATCTATLTTAISSLYPPPRGTPRTPTIPRVPVIVALLSLLLFALGLRLIPQTRRRAYAYAGLLVIALLVGVVAGCGGGGGGGGGNTRTIGATYSGDANYGQSSGTTTITVQ